jgi:hypothetical protein
MATTNAIKPVTQEAQSSTYEAAQGDSSNYQPTTSQVSNDATVQGRLEGLLSQGSKYMKVAESKANELSNKRGILNSSMAVGAAQKANIESALPIAQQDAGAFDLRERGNQAAQNQAGQFNAGQDQQMTQTNMASDNAAGQFNSGQDQQNSQFNATQQNSMAQEQWSQESSMAHDATMASLNSSLESGIIDQKAFANLRGQFLDSMTGLASESQINISEIQANANIPATEKTKLIENQIKMRDADMKAISELFSKMPMWQQNWSQPQGATP